MAFDLCAMYMAQIGEEVKHLTTESKNELSKTLDTSVLYQFRNMIDHTYEKVNKIMLSAYIEKAVRAETHLALPYSSEQLRKPLVQE